MRLSAEESWLMIAVAAIVGVLVLCSEGRYTYAAVVLGAMVAVVALKTWGPKLWWLWKTTRRQYLYASYEEARYAVSDEFEVPPNGLVARVAACIAVFVLVLTIAKCKVFGHKDASFSNIRVCRHCGRVSGERRKAAR